MDRVAAQGAHDTLSIYRIFFELMGSVSALSLILSYVDPRTVKGYFTLTPTTSN